MQQFVMTSFGWKKKTHYLNASISSTSSNQQGKLHDAFTNDVEENNEDNSPVESKNDSEGFINYDWRVDLKKRKLDQSSETSTEQINRLKNEGIMMAENQEYWQAIGRWDMALQLIDKNLSSSGDIAKFHHEMKSQALIQLHEWEPAIEAAEKAIMVDPKWYAGYQTLGRAHLGVGNVLDAVKTFSKARHINPADEEIKVQDLEWAVSLLTHQKLMAAAREINQTKALNDDIDVIEQKF